MDTDWRSLCEASDLRIDGNSIEVLFNENRHQVVTVNDEGDRLRLSAIVVRKAFVQGDDDLVMQAWRRNRATVLVGFRIDKLGKLVGEANVPKVGLNAEEFQTYLRAVARESDRFEFLLTGKDVE